MFQPLLLIIHLISNSLIPNHKQESKTNTAKLIKIHNKIFPQMLYNYQKATQYNIA